MISTSDDSTIDAARAITFGILGPLQIGGVDAAALEPNQRHVIAALLARDNHVVQIDELAASMWPATTPKNAKNQIQVHISRVRIGLGDARDIVRTAPNGYSVTLSPNQLDANRFARLTASAEHVLDNDPHRAVLYIDDALALWRGRAFGELRFTAATRGRADELEEQLIHARCVHVRALCNSGARSGAVAASSALVAEHPLREDVRLLNMQVLARAERGDDALASYREFCSKVRDAGGLRSSAIDALARELLQARDGVVPADAIATRRVCHASLDAGGDMTVVHAVWDAPPPAAGRPSGTGELGLRVQDAGGHILLLEHGRIAARVDGQASAREIALELADERGPRARVAIDRGTSIVIGGREVGPTIERARRVTRAGAPGQVLLTAAAATWLAAGTAPAGGALRHLGEHRLADLRRSEALFALRDARLSDDLAPSRTLGDMPNNLPDYADSFVGREREGAAVAELLSRHRLVTLKGPGGCGKTRLATHVAAEIAPAFSDGVFRVDLAAVHNPQLVAAEVARALGLPRNRMLPSVEIVVRHLRGRALLLLLDNCEHLRDACVQLIERLTTDSPTVRILATSTERLRAPGEHVWEVPPLELPDGVEEVGMHADALRLLVERVVACGDFRLDRAGAAVAVRLVRLLEGVPLAIEIVAPRVLSLGLRAITEELESAPPGDARLRLLEGDAPAHARHSTMALAVQWGYERLDNAEHALLRRLAVLAGSFSHADARAMAVDLDACALHALLRSLVDCSMLQAEHVAGSVRYRLLQPIRDYALARIELDDEAQSLRRRHALWFLSVAEQAEKALQGPGERSALQLYDEVHDNLRAALEWAVTAGAAEIAHRLVGATWWYWYMRAHMSEGRFWAARALALDGGTAVACAKTRNCSAHLAYWQGDFAHTIATLENLLNDPDVAGDARARGWAMMGIAAATGVFRTENGNRPLAVAQRSVELLRAGGRAWEHSYALVTLGVLLWFRGEYDAAVEPLDEALAIHNRLGPSAGLSSALRWRGLLAGLVGEYERGEAHCDDSLQISTEHQDRTGVVYGLLFLGMLARYRGDFDGARPLLARALAAGAEVGEFLGVRWALYGLAGCACADERFELATQLLARLDDIARATSTELAPAERAAADADRHCCRAALSDWEWRRACAAGERATPEQAVAAALAYGIDGPRPR